MLVHTLTWSRPSRAPCSPLRLPEALHVWSICVVGNSYCLGHSEPQNMTALRKEFWPQLPVILLCDLGGVPSSIRPGVPIWKMGCWARRALGFLCQERGVCTSFVSSVCPSHPHPCPSPACRNRAGMMVGLATGSSYGSPSYQEVGTCLKGQNLEIIEQTPLV